MTRITARYIIILCMLLIGAACIVVYFVDPTQTAWMPKCGFYLLTGLKCPACGGLRSAHALLHGHFYEAWMYNPMAVVTIPLAVIIIWRSLKGDKTSKSIDTTSRWVYAYIIVFMAWWVIRNIINF